MHGTVAGFDVTDAVAALENSLWSMWSAFGRGEGCHLVDTPALLRFGTPIPYVPYNSVLRSRLADDADIVIEQVLAAYDERRVQVMWAIHPTASPADLGRRLEAAGLVEAETCPGMVAPLARVPEPDPLPDGVELEKFVGDDRDDFIDLVAWRYALPSDAHQTLRSIMRRRGVGAPDCPTRAWVARMEGRIVSKVILHVEAGVAGLYGVATHPTARGLGLARNLTAAAFAAAREQGIEVGVLHSSPMAVSLYAGLGFEQVADFVLYGRPDTVHL